jgi:hypothetical protein
LAIDPGLTTGVAILDGELGITTLQLQPTELYEFITNMGDRLDVFDAIVCEAYMISPDTLRKSRQLWSLELIGFMRYVAWRSNITFKLQQASAAKKFVTNEMLKKYGLFIPGRDHANDALRHLVIYLVERQQMALPQGI